MKAAIEAVHALLTQPHRGMATLAGQRGAGPRRPALGPRIYRIGLHCSGSCDRVFQSRAPRSLARGGERGSGGVGASQTNTALGSLPSVALSSVMAMQGIGHRRPKHEKPSERSDAEATTRSERSDAKRCFHQQCQFRVMGIFLRRDDSPEVYFRSFCFFRGEGLRDAGRAVGDRTSARRSRAATSVCIANRIHATRMPALDACEALRR